MNLSRTSRRAVMALAMLAAAQTTWAAPRTFDDGARFAFVPSPGARSIYVIDLLDKTLAHTIDLVDRPDSIVASDRVKALVVASRESRRLTLIQLDDPGLGRIHYDIGMTPMQLLVSPPGESVAVYDRSARVLQVHAIRRRERLLIAEEVDTDRPLSFALDGTAVYWIDNAAGTLNSIDLWGARKSVALARPGSSLSAMSRSIDGSFGYVSDAGANTTYVVDLQNFVPATSVRVGSRPGRPWGTSDGRYMLVPNTGDGTVTAISGITGLSIYTVRTIDQPGFIGAGWLDTTGAAVGAAGEMVFFDVETGAVRDRHDLAAAPLDGVVTSDSVTLALPLPTKGTIALFDMRRMTMLTAITGLPDDIGGMALAISNNLCH